MVVRFCILVLLWLSPPLMLQASEHESLTFETFFNQHPSPMWMIDIDTGTIVNANPAAETFYGYEALEGMNIDQINMLTPEQIKQETALAGQSGRNHLFFRHRLANDEVKLVGIYTNRFNWQGQDVLLSALYDTSEFEPAAERHYIDRVEEQVDLQTKQLQRAKDWQFWIAVVAGIAQTLVIAILVLVLVWLRRANRENNRLVDELSFRNEELVRLSHVMAHHFQEPSRRLVSFAQQVSRQAKGVDNSRLQVATDFIQEQAKRLSDLVGDVQRYLSLDHIKPILENIDVGKHLDRVYKQDKMLEPAREQGALQVPDNLPDVYFDARRLELIFTALLHNAWTYRNPERDLEVRVSARRKGQRIVFCVADNGSGIAPEYRKQVLELFSRLVASKDKLPGTGMGLALVVKALRAVDGHLWIEDGIDGGTAVYFDLPESK